MKKLALGSPPQGRSLEWAVQSLKKIERASYEDAELIFDGVTITGSFVETRTLDPSSATLDDLLAFIATLVTDIQKRGQNRSGV